MVGRPLTPLFQSFPVGEVHLSECALDRRNLLQCLSCGLRYHESIPSLSSLSSLYDAAGLEQCWASAGREKLLHERLAFIGPDLDRMACVSVLDIGCHTGEFLSRLPSGWLKSGCEINKRSALQAEALLPSAVIEADRFEDAQFEAASFDLITAWDVMEHIHTVDLFVGKVYALLKPGGFFVFETGNYASFYAKLAGLAWYYYSLLEHTVFFSAGVVETALFRFGFESVMVVETNHDHAGQRLMGTRCRAGLIAAYTLRGRLPILHSRLARWLNRAGTLPQPQCKDHMLVIAQKPGA